MVPAPPLLALLLPLALLLVAPGSSRAARWDGESQGHFVGLAVQPIYTMTAEVVVDGFLNITGDPAASPRVNLQGRVTSTRKS